MISINKENVKDVVEQFNEMNSRERNAGNKDASKNFKDNLQEEFCNISYTTFCKQLNSFNYYYKNGLFIYEEREEEEVSKKNYTPNNNSGLIRKKRVSNYINSSISVDEKIWKEFNKFCEEFENSKAYIISDALQQYMNSFQLEDTEN